MKRRVYNFFGIVGIVFLVAIFFYKTLINGLLPVPTDTLVGMYHPWRDAYAHTFTNGVPFKNFLITDPVRQQIPWRKQVIDSIKNKKLPLWDATSFSGAPLLANIQSGAFYPLNILFFVFPFEMAWTILIISQPLLAGIFLFLFLRHKNLEVVSSLIGSVCFAFSGFSISWLTWGTISSTILWLPLSMLAFEKIHEAQKKNPWRIAFILAVAFSFFAGHLQIFFYSMITLGVYALWSFRKIKMTKMSVMHILIPVIIGVITAPVWTRFISFYPETARALGSAWTVDGFFIPLRHLVQFIAPDFFGNPATLNYWGTWNYGEMVGYVGVIGLLLAIVGISAQSVFWVGTIIISLLCAVDSPVARLPFVLHIPVLSSLQPTRLLSMVDLSLSILAAYGMEHLIQKKKIKQLYIGLGLLLAAFVGLWISVLVPKSFGILAENLLVVKRNLILPSIMFVAGVGMMGLVIILKKSWVVVRYVGTIIIFVLVAFDLIRFGWKFTPFTNSSFFFPKTETLSLLEQSPKPFRVVAVDDRLVPPNVFTYYGIESISGYDPIYTSRYEEYIGAMERGKPNITPPFGFNRIITPKTITSPLFSLLNVQYVLSMDPLVGTNVRLLLEEGTTKLYKYVGGTPRVYLAEQVINVSSKQAVMDGLYAGTFVPGKTAIVESPISFGSSPIQSDESVTLSSYEGDRITIDTKTLQERLLVIGNMMDTHWNVTIDGASVGVYRVNYLFFGVIVPEGIHKVVVQYR